MGAVGSVGLGEGIEVAGERWQVKRQRERGDGKKKKVVADRRGAGWTHCGSVCGQSRACVADRATSSAMVRANKRAGRWRTSKRPGALVVEEMKGRCEPWPKREGLVAESDRLWR